MAPIAMTFARAHLIASLCVARLVALCAGPLTLAASFGRLRRQILQPQDKTESSDPQFRRAAAE